MKTTIYVLAVMLAIGAVMATGNVDIPDACKQLEKGIVAKESYADLNNDGIVDLTDIAIFTKNMYNEEFCNLAMKPVRVVTVVEPSNVKCSSGTSESSMWYWLAGKHRVEYDSPMSYLANTFVKKDQFSEAYSLLASEICDLKWDMWKNYHENNACKKEKFAMIS